MAGEGEGMKYWEVAITFFANLRYESLYGKDNFINGNNEQYATKIFIANSLLFLQTNQNKIQQLTNFNT